MELVVIYGTRVTPYLTLHHTSYADNKKLIKNNSFMNEKENIKECQTLHTSTLNEIFFETLDEIDCFKDPFSILR